MQANSGGSGSGSGTRARLQARLNGASHDDASGSSPQRQNALQGRAPNDRAMTSGSAGLSSMKMPVSNGRMPQAPASLLVQLPPDELRRIMAEQQQARGNATAPSASSVLALQNQAVAASARLGLASPSGSKQAMPTQPMGVSDVAMLAASLKERREHEARVFIWQQRLIGGVTTDRTMLKKALTQLSLPAWLQVLQERHLAHRCAYPTCSRAPKRTHFSHNKSSVLASDAPRYRISLRRRAIERDERDDAGGEHAFCSDACWRRAEWVSRWVLNGGASTRSVRRAITEGDDGLLAAEANGGRWARNMDEAYWTEVELLEDLEDRGEVDKLSHAPSLSSSPQAIEQVVPHQAAAMGGLPPIVAAFELDETGTAGAEAGNRVQRNNMSAHGIVLRGDKARDPFSVLGKDRAVKREQQRAAGTAENFLTLLDSLEIRERTARQGTSEILGEDPEDDEREHTSPDDMARLSNSIPDIDMAEDEGRSILNADQAHAQARHQHNSASGAHEPAKGEEDDLFEQAWAAMDEERAQGRWEDE